MSSTKTPFSFARLLALLRKETLQILRDPSVLLVAMGLPLIFIVIYGYGISMDLERIPVAVAIEEPGPAGDAIRGDFTHSPWFDPVFTTSRTEAERLMASHEVVAVLEIPAGFSRDMARDDAQLGLTINALDAQTATIIRTYVTGAASAALSGALQTRGASAALASGTSDAVTVTARSWFNEGATTTWYIVPGLLVVILAVIGGFVASLVVAREWERGTMATVMATPVRPIEILLGKLIPYLILALIGFLLTFILAIALFEVPVRGSLGLIALVALAYGLWSTALGLFVSAKMKNQFLANEAAILCSFLPTLMLSGFLFDLRSVPWVIRAIGEALPPYYAIEALRTLFLSGGNTDRVLLCVLVILLWSAAALAGTYGALRKGEKKAKAPAKKEAS